MGGLFRKKSPPPPPPAPAPTAAETGQKAAEQKRKQMKNRYTRKKTIATGGQGVEEEAQIAYQTLIGSSEG